MSDLRDQLTEISGVGDATEDKIIEVVDQDSELPEAVYSAYDHAQDGNARMAASYLAQVVDGDS